MNYKYYQCEEGNSQYDDIDLNRENRVDARYIPSVLESDRGNPFIEALPLPRQSDDVWRAYSKSMPGYSFEKTKNMTPLAKMLQIDLLRTDVRFPLPFQKYLEINIYNTLVISYRSRKIIRAKGRGLIYVAKNEEELSNCILMGDLGDSTNAGSSMTGFSGCGKSTSVGIAISPYPKLIMHTYKDGYFPQIPILIVTCEAHSNFKALYHEIGNAIDKALGNYFEPVYAAEIDRIQGLGNKSAKITEYIEDFAIGLIIFDEIQLIDFNNDKENSFNSLLTIANRTKVGMLFIGTEDAREKMFSELRIARRAGTDINGNSYCGNKEYFSFLVSQLFEYQWFDEFVEPDDEIINTLYELTHGIVDQLVGLYSCMNYEYIYRNKKPKVDSKFIRWVSKEYYSGIQNVLNSLDDPDSDSSLYDINKNAMALMASRKAEIEQKEEAQNIINNTDNIREDKRMLINITSNIKASFDYPDNRIEAAYRKVMKKESAADMSERELSRMVVKQLLKEDENAKKKNSTRSFAYSIPEDIDTSDLRSFVENDNGEND